MPAANSDREACRSCGSTAVPIIYGLPSDRAMEAAERGEVRLGGCAIPHWPTCKRCGNAITEEAGSGRLPLPSLLRAGFGPIRARLDGRRPGSRG